MTNAGNNIFSLLLGITGGSNIPSENVVSGINIKPTPTALPFSNFLNPLLTESGENNTPSPLPGDNATGPNNSVVPAGFDFLLAGEEPQETLSRESSLINPSAEFVSDDIGEMSETAETEIIFDARRATDLLKTNGYDIEAFHNNNIGNIEPSLGITDTEAGASDNIGLPLQAFRVNKYLNDIINSQAVKLVDGNYNIIEAETVDSQLMLTVQAKDNPTQQIKISLPADQLQTVPAADKTVATESDNGRSNRTARVALNLNGVKENQSKLDDLFSKLDLKELQIKTSETGTDKVSSDTISAKNVTDVKIVAENAGQEVIIKGKIQNGEIKTRADRKNDRAAIRENSGTFSEADGEELSVKAEKADVKFAQRINAAGQKTGNPADDFNLLKNLSREKSDEGARVDTSRLFQEITMEQLPRTSNNQTVRASATPVRFTLPENIAQTLQPNGWSVMLKIDPDHLGTARLHLTMRDNSLTARVTVDNIPAKNALESSLNQLTEQLNRNGIQVDYIEVGVSGDETRDRAFSRSPQWNRSGQAGGLDSDSEFLSDIDQITQPLSAPVTYIGSGGVNLFA